MKIFVQPRGVVSRTYMNNRQIFALLNFEKMPLIIGALWNGYISFLFNLAGLRQTLTFSHVNIYQGSHIYKV